MLLFTCHLSITVWTANKSDNEHFLQFFFISGQQKLCTDNEPYSTVEGTTSEKEEDESGRISEQEWHPN